MSDKFICDECGDDMDQDDGLCENCMFGDFDEDEEMEDES